MNNNFLLKLVSDEISETLFFATGCKVLKTKPAGVINLIVDTVTVIMVAHNNILVNGKKFKNCLSARHYIQTITN